MNKFRVGIHQCRNEGKIVGCQHSAGSGNVFPVKVERKIISFSEFRRRNQSGIRRTFGQFQQNSVSYRISENFIGYPQSFHRRFYLFKHICRSSFQSGFRRKIRQCHIINVVFGKSGNHHSFDNGGYRVRRVYFHRNAFEYVGKNFVRYASAFG